MSNTQIRPRLEYLDVDTARMALGNRIEHVPKLLAMIEAEPTKLLQQRYNSLAGDYESIALFSYALGYSTDIVIEAFKNAVGALRHVFRLRGTLPPFEAYVVEPSREVDGSPFAMRPLADPNSRDFSLTNSRKCYYAVCKALIVNDEEAAQELAGAIWDPPGASYIGANSFCTPTDQNLAYALRAFYERAPEFELVLDRNKGRSIEISSQVTMLRSLAKGDVRGFLEGLDSLLQWHEREARSKKNRSDPEFFLCLSGLGLSRLALRNRICQSEQLPGDSPFLPAFLLTSSNVA